MNAAVQKRLPSCTGDEDKKVNYVILLNVALISAKLKKNNNNSIPITNDFLFKGEIDHSN